MKTFAFLSLAATALAQSVSVSLPAAQSNQIQAGSDLVVQVIRPNSLTGSEEIGVAIGIRNCPTLPCAPAESVLGTVLYNGPYDPEYHEVGNQPYENFTVTVPETLQTGRAIIGVAHATLIGAGPWPFLEVVNVTATVV
ncbi:hypothetical protein BJY01DRAFT_199413 [Aspergillus pseudoustus]|uniref:Phosphatidylglycerol/phosphatidylinositol transfer protein n=1 Tax=Aspergillus pseudoustus TaxID=1810923 RepID=A0ABR4JS76_9EURO